MSLAKLEQPAPAADDTDLPEGWTLTAIGCTCQLNPPKPPVNTLPSDSPVTFVPMSAVDAQGGTISTPLQRPYSGVRNSFTAFADGDVIMAKITPCMENGKAAIARGLVNGLGFGSTEFHVLRSNGAALPEYVYHFIRQETFRRLAESEMTGSVGQRRVPADFLREAEFPLPPLAEQRRIVAKVKQLLAAASTTRARLARVPTLLKQFRQAVLTAACSGRLTADWRQQNPDVEPASRLLERILAERRAKWEGEQTIKTQKRPSGTLALDLAGPVGEPLFRKQQVSGRVKYQESAAPDVSELPELPETWCWANLEQLYWDAGYGTSVKCDYSAPGPAVLRIPNVAKGCISNQDLKYATDTAELKKEQVVAPGDFLVVRTNGSKDLIGRGSIVTTSYEQPHYFASYLIRLRLIQFGGVEQFIAWLWQSEYMRQLIEADAVSSAGQYNISLSKLSRFPVPLPPLGEQQEIVRRVETLFRLAKAIEKRTAAAARRADRLPQAILAKAFRGELVPTEAALARAEGRDYEPASVLLAVVQEAQRERQDSTGKRRKDSKTTHVVMEAR